MVVAADSLAALRSGALAGARSLTLRDRLDRFPREILDLADTLEVLDLSGTGLSALPEDFGRLRRLRVLFCSSNRFRVLPPVLGDCPALSQVGFRDAGIEEMPADSLPERLRWLTVTGNRLQSLPPQLGERRGLRKLMLSGNRLDRLPDSLAALDGLELLRLSANRLEALPSWLERMPRLAWLAFAGNPLDRRRAPDAPVLAWNRLELSDLLGEGASGLVYRARTADGRAVAVKLFRGAMTSDGLPEREMEACLAAGDHPNLCGGLGRIEGHPDNAHGLAMRLLPDGWRALAGPPSLRSCTRDVYAPGLRLPLRIVARLAGAIAAAGAHLHRRSLSHGDLYAHNVLWDGEHGDAVLSDFGAGAFLPEEPEPLRRALRGFDVLAWGILLDELLERGAADDPALGERLAALRDACLVPVPSARPGFAAIRDAIAA